jgi:DNA modification methylase
MEKKIIVLSKSFNSEEERRSYFRQELRKKLPKLKKIEGFPIGEDEDILNLSDPPFYTVCPNPWINDFITQWEEEKKEIEKEGKRHVDFEVNEPYAADVSEGKNNPIYMAHSYHTKVPHPAIMRYILHYTQPGDIVFDGFAGTGMTGVAASMCENPSSELRSLIELDNRHAKWGKRKYIGGDLSTIANYISYNYNNPTNAFNFYNKANEIFSTLKKELEWIYETYHGDNKIGTVNYTVWSDVYVCGSCNEEIIFWDSAIDKLNEKVLSEFECLHCRSIQTKNTVTDAIITQFDNITGEAIAHKKRVPVLINYTFNGKRHNKIPDENDLNIITRIESNVLSCWVPLNKIIDGDEIGRLKNELIHNVSELFPKRTLIVLSKIIELANTDNRFQLLVTSILQNVSWLYRWRSNGKGGTTSGTYYICATPQENNVFNQLERKLSDFSTIFNILNINNSNSVIYNCSSTEILLKANSVDYIFIDPPFGSNIMYSELNFMWESWLKVLTNNNKEAISNRSQSKSTFDYQILMQTCFTEFYRILKPNRWMTVEFSNTSAAVWNSIQNSLQLSGFVISNVSTLDKKQGSFKAVNTPTAVQQDLIITCYKPSDEFVKNFKMNENSNFAIWDFMTEHLNHLPVHLNISSSTTAIIERNPKILYDRLIAFYIQKGLPVPIDALKFQQGLKDHFIERDGMFFTNEQVLEYDTKKAAVPNFTQLSIFVANENDSIYWLRSNLEKDRKTESELQPAWMKEVAGNMRKGDALPEMRTILEDNFLKDENGKWYIPDPENEADLQKLRNKRLLKQFEIYKTEAANPRSKIKECRVEALRVGFKQCYQDKDFKTIVTIGDRIPNNLLMEDEVLLQFYDIANSRI